MNDITQQERKMRDERMTYDQVMKVENSEYYNVRKERWSIMESCS